MRLAQRRLQSQLLFSVVAALSVTALSILLIGEALGTAQRIVIADARQTLNGALAQLTRQYRERVGGDLNWPSLPIEAQDLSLHAVARIVFLSYSGVDGGYEFEDRGAPVDGGSAAFQRALRNVVSDASSTGSAGLTVPDGHDLMIFEARRIGPSDPVAWAYKRLAGRNDPWVGQRQMVLVALALAGLFSVAGVIATGVRLHRGIGEIRQGLQTLEEDFAYRLPESRDELGDISSSINRMAAARVTLEAEVAREQRLRSMGKLVAGVAHEIRNPLNSIRLAMEMFERRLIKNTLRGEDLRMVCAEVDRLNQLLTDLLTFDQARRPARERHAVADVVRDCLDLLRPQAEESGIRLALVDPDAALEGTFDPQRLKQAVLNLVLNAIQATAPGGVVRVVTAPTDRGVHLSVQDGGPGLSEEQQEHLFEAFYTTKPNGTGLGLAVSHELIAGMGGELIYESGHPGAVFQIDLPARTTPHG